MELGTGRPHAVENMDSDRGTPVLCGIVLESFHRTMPSLTDGLASYQPVVIVICDWHDNRAYIPTSP